MSIAEFIRESVLRPRLKQAGCLVVYDADRCYREQRFDLANEKIRVIDASESSIESREAALLALREVGQPKAPLECVLIYVPARRPETDEQKQVDPFALYAECGAVFPQDDGDEYLSICLRARPDHATEIRQVFSGSSARPTFAVIDAIGGGVSWPQLRTTLRVESGREILAAPHGFPAFAGMTEVDSPGGSSFPLYRFPAGTTEASARIRGAFRSLMSPRFCGDALAAWS